MKNKFNQLLRRLALSQWVTLPRRLQLKVWRRWRRQGWEEEVMVERKCGWAPGRTCGPICLSLSSCSLVSCDLPVPEKGCVKRLSQVSVSLKETIAKNILWSLHSQMKEKVAKLLPLNRKTGQFCLPKFPRKEGKEVYINDKVTASSLCGAFPDPLVLGVVDQNSDSFWLRKGKTKPKNRKGERKRKLSQVTDLLFSLFLLSLVHPSPCNGGFI